jgi:DNA-binding LacI/PurR family transcriptional regulator
MVGLLTTIHQPKLEIGEKSMELLLQKMADPETAPQSVVLEPELIIRRSA